MTKTTLCTHCIHCPNPDMKLGKYCDKYDHNIDDIIVVECIHYKRKVGE